MPIATFLWFILLTAYTPGPNNILAMSHAIRHGFAKTLPLCMGMQTGFFVVIGGCVLFSSFLRSFAPAAEPVMRLLGAAYIAYLAWNTWRDKGGRDNDGEDTPTTGFGTGLLLQCVNIKFILYGLTAMSTFIVPHSEHIYEVIAYCLILIAGASSANILWALFGNAFQKIFSRYGRQLNAIMALLLLYCAVMLVVR